MKVFGKLFKAVALILGTCVLATWGLWRYYWHTDAARDDFAGELQTYFDIGAADARFGTVQSEGLLGVVIYNAEVYHQQAYEEEVVYYRIPRVRVRPALTGVWPPMVTLRVNVSLRNQGHIRIVGKARLWNFVRQYRHVQRGIYPGIWQVQLKDVSLQETLRMFFRPHDQRNMLQRFAGFVDGKLRFYFAHPGKLESAFFRGKFDIKKLTYDNPESRLTMVSESPVSLAVRFREGKLTTLDPLEANFPGDPLIANLELDYRDNERHFPAESVERALLRFRPFFKLKLHGTPQHPLVREISRLHTPCPQDTLSWSLQGTAHKLSCGG